MISEEQKRQVREGFIHQGYYILDEFISTHECESLLSTIHQFRQKHQITEIHREMKPRSLHYFVINGEDVEEFLPDILHLSRDVHTLVQEVVAANLHPLENKKVSVNINITPPGGEYRWHYDRNALTILIYLNTVSGGEIEFCPNYRLFLPGRSHTSLQNGWT